MLDLASPLDGFGSPFGARRGVTPLTIFGSRLMFWFDPSDVSSLSQDNLGATPVAALNDPIGRITDKSGKGNHATQSNASFKSLWKQDANGCFNAQFDGIDDSWVTGAIDFSGSDKVAVFAGVRKLSDAAVGALVEFSTTPASNSGMFNMLAPRLSPSGGPYSFLSRGTTTADAVSINSAFNAPNTAVLTGIGDIGNDVAILRINGAQSASVATDQGSGNYGNYSLYIGRRGGASLAANINLYQIFGVSGAVTAAEIAAAEACVNARTKAY